MAQTLNRHRVGYVALVALGALLFATPIKADEDDIETAYGIAQCRANFNYCREDINLKAGLWLTMTCKTTFIEATDADVERVLSWLEAHPQVEPHDWYAALANATEALWTCSK